MGFRHFRPGWCWRSTCLLAVLGVGLLGVLAARADEAVPASARGLANSAAFPRDRVAESKWKQAQELLARGELRTGVAAVAQLVEQQPEALLLVPSESIVSSDEFARQVSAHVRRLLTGAAEDVRQLYRQQVDPRANAALQVAQRARDTEALRQVVRRFPMTDAEVRALQTLAAIAADAGNIELARVIGRQLREHPLLPDNEKAHWGRWQARLDDWSTRTREVQSVLQEPEAVPRWTAEVRLAEDAVAMLRDGLSEQVESSFAVLPRAKPLLVGRVAVTRQFQQTTAFDVTTGRELWSTAKGTGDFLNVPTNASLLRHARRASARHWQLDSINSGMTRQSDLVIAVEPSRHPFAGVPSGTLKPKHAPGQQRSILQARRATTGDVVWTCDGECFAPETSGTGVEFLGPPLSVDRELWGLAQVESSIVAYVLNGTDGSTLAVSRVGVATRDHIADSDWRLIAAKLNLVDGQLLCVTGAGLMLSINPVTRDVQWAWRYERDDVPPEAMQLLGTRASEAGRHWWRFWREQTLQASPSAAAVIVASTDRRGVWALRSEGTLLWQAPIPDGLIFAGCERQRVLVLGKHAALSLDEATGRVLKQVPISSPTGSGFWSQLAPGRQYVFPTAKGLMAVDPVELHVVALSSGSRARFNGNVVDLATGALQQNLHSVERFEWPADLKAAQQLSALPEPKWQQLRAEAEKLNQAEPTYLEAMLRAARAARQQGDEIAALEAYRQLSQLSATPLRQSDAIGPRLNVRLDQLIASEVADMLAASAPETRQTLRNRLLSGAEQARQSPDPFAMQRFAQRWGDLPELRPVLFDRQTRIGQSYAQSMLPLWSLLDVDDDMMRARAAIELANLLQARSYEEDAVDVIEAVASLDVSGWTDAERQPLARVLTDWRERVAGHRKEFWPLTRPTVTEQVMSTTRVAFSPLPVEAVSGSLWERLDVSWNLQGESLRFTGDGRAGDWTLELAKPAHPFRRVGTLARGWGIGQVLIVQLGIELFAVTPFDDNGEQRAKLLWSSNFSPNFDLNGHRVLPARLGFADQELQFLDPNERVIGQVGPVRADYLCVRENGRLVCLDTSTGAIRWQRDDLPEEASITGDATAVYVTDISSGRVDALRCWDGALKHQHEFPTDAVVVSEFEHRQVRRHRDGWLRCVDLRTGQSLWNRELFAGDLLFAADAKTLGVCGADGECVLLNLISGTEALRFHVERPAKVEFLACRLDREKCLLAISGPRTHFTPEGQFDAIMRRNPLFHGRLFAIDRQSGRRLWSHPVTDGNYVLDQPRSLPFVVLISTLEQPGGHLVELLDARRGEKLFSTRSMHRETFPLFRQSQAQPSATMRLSAVEVRIQYPAVTAE